jgi:hypothetical protein
MTYFSDYDSETWRRWHTITSHVAAAFCEAGYPCSEEHDHDADFTEGGGCRILFDDAIPPLDVCEKAFTLCNAYELWESLKRQLMEGYGYK